MTAIDATTGGSLGEGQLATLERLLRVAYPHERVPDGPYQRTAHAVVDREPDRGLVAEGLAMLDAAAGPGGFAALDDAAATRALLAVQATPFFRHVIATAVVALYDDHETWAALGYEGASFDRGGYLHRGFDDLDWLPEPRIEENTTDAWRDVVPAWGTER